MTSSGCGGPATGWTATTPSRSTCRRWRVDALMSPGHFSRSFRAAFGETPYSHLMTRRIERAKALLRRGDLSVTEVCFAVGCTSLGSFSSRFSRLVGESPSSYRARNHDQGAGIPACMAKIHTRPVRNGEARPAAQP